MARARLHIICGNCGCNDQMSYQVVLDGHDVSEETPKFTPAVWIRCGNCATLHDLATCMPETLASPAASVLGKHPTL